MSHCRSLAAVGRSRRIEIPPSAAEFKREKVELKENIESEAKYPGHNAIRSRFSCCCRRVWGKGVAGRKQLDQINRLAPFQQPVANNKRWQAKKNAAERRAIFNRRIDEGFQYYSPSSLLVCCYLSRGRGKYLSASAICKSDTGAWSIAGRSAESMLDKIRIYPVARHRFCLLDVIDATRPTFISLCPWAAN